MRVKLLWEKIFQLRSSNDAECLVRLKRSSDLGHPGLLAGVRHHVTGVVRGRIATARGPRAVPGHLRAPRSRRMQGRP